MSHDDELRELEQQLRIERIEREASQRRVSKLGQNAAIWRKRAEARADRIARLEAERDELRTLKGWMRSAIGRRRKTSGSTRGTPAAQPTPTVTGPVRERSRPRPFGSVSVVSIGVADAVLASVLAEMDESVATSDISVLDRADLVVVEDATALDEDASGRFEQWVASPGRPPIVWVGQPASDPRDVSVARTWCEGDEGEVELLPAFGSDLDAGGAAEDSPFDPFDPRILTLAAAGRLGPSGDGFEERRIRALARRRAFRDHGPWIIASRILEAAGVDAGHPLPRVAGILVSNRPDQVVGAMEQFFRQTYPRLELVVACHGIDASAARSSAEIGPTHIAVTVLEMEAGKPLGVCINDAVEHSSAEVMAKIDDDDHYGIGYLEDAVHAIFRTGAELVGKGACLTYIGSEDRTVLRRPDIRERFYRGSPNGGSLVFRRAVWEQSRFGPRTVGEDAAFIRSAVAAGVLPYATEPFDYIYVRSTSGNTWAAVDEVFTDNAIDMWDGLRSENADIEQ